MLFLTCKINYEQNLKLLHTSNKEKRDMLLVAANSVEFANSNCKVDFSNVDYFLNYHNFSNKTYKIQSDLSFKKNRLS